MTSKAHRGDREVVSYELPENAGARLTLRAFQFVRLLTPGVLNRPIMPYSAIITEPYRMPPDDSGESREAVSASLSYGGWGEAGKPMLEACSITLYDIQPMAPWSPYHDIRGAKIWGERRFMCEHHEDGSKVVTLSHDAVIKAPHIEIPLFDEIPQGNQGIHPEAWQQACRLADVNLVDYELVMAAMHRMAAHLRQRNSSGEAP